jgi:hypothetical protein
MDVISKVGHLQAVERVDCIPVVDEVASRQWRDIPSLTAAQDVVDNHNVGILCSAGDGVGLVARVLGEDLLHLWGESLHYVEGEQRQVGFRRSYWCQSCSRTRSWVPQVVYLVLVPQRKIRRGLAPSKLLDSPVFQSQVDHNNGCRNG